MRNSLGGLRYCLHELGAASVCQLKFVNEFTHLTARSNTVVAELYQNPDVCRFRFGFFSFLSGHLIRKEIFFEDRLDSVFV